MGLEKPQSLSRFNHSRRQLSDANHSVGIDGNFLMDFLSLCFWYDSSTMYALRWHRKKMMHPKVGYQDGQRCGPSNYGVINYEFIFPVNAPYPHRVNWDAAYAVKDAFSISQGIQAAAKIVRKKRAIRAKKESRRMNNVEKDITTPVWTRLVLEPPRSAAPTNFLAANASQACHTLAPSNTSQVSDIQ